MAEPAPAPAAEPVPPQPERRPKLLRAHGDERVDDWYWLRDRDDPAVLAHLRAENVYTEALLAPLEPFRQRLYQEMLARIDQTDLSVPVRRGPWWYYGRTVEGRDYTIHCRRPALPAEAPPLDREPSPDEQVILDENSLAEGFEYFDVGTLAVSPDHRLVAFSTDTTGAERFALRFALIGGESGAPDEGESGALDEVVPDTYYGLAWANDNATVFYTRMDAAMRPYQLWRHRLGTDPADDVLVLEEPDERFNLGVGRTKNGAFVVIALQSTTTSEVWVIPADDPSSPPRVLDPRRAGVEYRVEHHRSGAGGQGRFVIVTNDDAEDFRVMAAPDGSRGHHDWRQIIAHRPGTRVDDVDVFERHLVVAERLEAEATLRVVPLDPDPGEDGPGADPFAGDLLGRSWLVPSSEHPATTWEGPNPEPGTRLLRFQQSSLLSPTAVSDVDLQTAAVELRKRQRVLGGYDPGAYCTFRLWADGADGTRIPISVVHRRDLLADGASPGSPPAVPAPTVLYGYGAYEHSVDPVFSSLRLSLLDRGVVFAVAHVRGGGELGRHWYEQGRLAFKENSFADFLACARFLVDQGYTATDRLAARGGSAGGLLVAAALNQAPELFRAVVAEVPFVDVLTTMLDPTLPLTVGEWEEWGDPAADPETYDRLKAYSPYDNVAPAAGRTGPDARFPSLFVTAGLNDARVGFWEPAKWVTKIRAAHPEAEVLLRVELGAGHGGPSGRYDAWKEEALIQAFLVDSLGATV